MTKQPWILARADGLAQAAGLRAAAAMITEDSFIQGPGPHPDNRRSLEDAIYLGFGPPPSANPTARSKRQIKAILAARDRVARYLRFKGASGVMTLTTWNNAPGRTAAEVRAMLIAVAEDIESYCSPEAHGEAPALV